MESDSKRVARWIGEDKRLSRADIDGAKRCDPDHRRLPPGLGDTGTNTQRDGMYRIGEFGREADAVQARIARFQPRIAEDGSREKKPNRY